MRDFNYDTESILAIEKPEALIVNDEKVKWLRSGGIETKQDITEVVRADWDYYKRVENKIFLETYNKFACVDVDALGHLSNWFFFGFQSLDGFDVKKEGNLYKIIIRNSSTLRLVDFDGESFTEIPLNINSYKLSWGKTQDGIDCIYSGYATTLSAYSLSGSLISSATIPSTVRDLKYYDGCLYTITDTNYYKHDLPTADGVTGFSEDDSVEILPPSIFGSQGLISNDGYDIAEFPFGGVESDTYCSSCPSGMTGLRLGYASGTIMGGKNGEWRILGRDNKMIEDTSGENNYNLSFDNYDGIL